MKVLLVEDDQALCMALAQALTDAGLLVETSGTGGDADFLVRTERYLSLIHI